ncbi:MAG: hypothetical protein ACRD4I_18095, partial [Candidatus Angelobacter sp.]
RHGIAWYEVDMNWYGIWVLKKLGLARHIYRVKIDQLPVAPPLTGSLAALDLATDTSPSASAD